MKLLLTYFILLALTLIGAMSTKDWVVLLTAPLTCLILAPIVLVVLKLFLFFRSFSPVLGPIFGAVRYTIDATLERKVRERIDFIEPYWH